METERLNLDSCPLSNIINPDLTNELMLDSNMKTNTKNILESVCNDFENIDVGPPKENKYTMLKKWKVPGDFAEYSNDGSGITSEPVIRSTRCIFEDDTILSNSESSEINISNSMRDENSNISSVVEAPSFNSQNQKSNDIVSSNKDVQTETLPLQDSAKVGINPQNFSTEKNLSSSLAELADAELVRTSENSVSIIISNPRFIQVVRTPKSSDIPPDTLNSNDPSSEKGNINDVIVESPLSDYGIQKMNTDTDGHPEVASEIIYADDVDESSDSYNSPHSSTPKTYLSKKERNKTYFRSRAELGRFTKARRITAKMKAEWAKKLAESGFLMCPMFGCFQKYRTIANFITHYKHCCCGTEKDLKHCPYCASVIFSSSKAVLHHMEVEHPERLEEYKASYPEPHDIYEITDDDSSRLIEISLRDKSVKCQKKRKFLAKENRLSPKKRILKHKIKTMNESVIENSKFKECGHFDKIVSKISSVNDKTNTHTRYADENRISKDRRKRRLIVTGHVVTAEKYFEDERDIEVNKEIHSNQEKEKVNTKSRLVLNMDRYKRYSQYLTVTRDWASHRRTYSRPKNLDNVLDSSNLINMQNESSELDIHQLNSSLESSNISLNQNEPFSLSQSVCDKNLSTEISNFGDSLESDINFISRTPVEIKMQSNSITDSVMNNKTNDLSTENVVRERRPCYLNQNNIITKSTLSTKSDVVRKQSMRITPIITYGKIPDSLLKKSDEKRPPVIDFDSFIKNSIVTHKAKNISNEKKVSNSVKPAKHNKEDGIKHPLNEPLLPEKRKRGRPRKVSLKEIPGVYEEKTVKQIMQSTDPKNCNKSLSEKFRKYGLKNKTSSVSKNSRKVKNSKKVVMTHKERNRINSKIVRHKIRMKFSAQARFSLKKAIMCGVKRNATERGRKRRGFTICSRKSGRVKGLLKNKYFQQNEDVSLSDKASDHNFCSTDATNDIKTDENLNNSVQTQTDISFEEQKEEIICTPSKEMENSFTLQSEREEKTVSPQIACQENVHSLTQSCTSEEMQLSSFISEPLPTSDSTISKQNMDDLNIVDSETSIPPVPDIDKPLNSSPVIMKRSRGRPRKNNVLNPVETNVQLLESANSSPSISASVAVRKSERVRKRKLVGDPVLGTEVEEKNTPSRVQKSALEPQPEKTGRRGRPRKYPKVEKIVSNNEASEYSHTDTSIPTADSSLNDNIPDNSNTVQKGSRKGRPRKNLDLEKLDGDSKADGELEKTKDVSEEHQEVQENFPVSSQNCTCMHSQEKKKGLILPLKKRKQIGETEEIIKGVKNNVCSCEESTVKIPTKETSKRKVAFEEPISSKIKASIPVLNLQNTISHSSEKNTMDNLPDNRTLEKFPDSQYSCEIIFPEFKPDISKFKFCNRYEEHFKTNIQIKIDNSPDWIKLKCFESIAHEGSNNSTFFIGGPVQCSAFCPTPRNKIVNQYIAVASSHILHKRHSYIHTKSCSGFIQFWNLGCLHESSVLNKAPSMELAIYHTHGLISEMKWCPKGCYDDASKTDGLPRLGLLALSCADSCVRVYTVPQPNLMPEIHSDTFPVYCTSPSVMLAPLCGGPCSVTRKSMATCIEWQKNGQQIAAGYGNGTICVWMLKTSTTITTYNEEKLLTIQPYIVFQAGGTPVTSISFAPLNNCRWLVSSSFDKTLRFFDLYDTCMPFCSVKRGFAFNCEWGRDFCGAYVSLHDGIIFKGSAFAKECGIEEPAAQNISGSVTSLTYSSISSITNAQAIADMTGAVTLNFVHNLYDQGKMPCDDFAHVIFQTDVVTLNIKKNRRKVKNTCEVASIIDEMEHIVDVIDNVVSYCESQASSSSYSTVSNIKMPISKNVEISVKEAHCINADEAVLESVELGLEDRSVQKASRELLNNLIESVVVKETEEKYLLEIMNNLIKSVIGKESEEKCLKEIIDYLIKSVIAKESEEKSVLEINEKLLGYLIESVVRNEMEEKCLLEAVKELLSYLIELVVVKESEEKYLLLTNKQLLHNLIESVMALNSKEKSTQETTKELLDDLIGSVIRKELEEKSIQETTKELLDNLIESVITKELVEKSLQQTSKNVLDNLIETVVAAEYEKKLVQDTNEELLYSPVESVVMDPEEKSLEQTNKELLYYLIESVVTKESEEKSLQKTSKELLNNLIDSVVTLESEEKSVQETNESFTESIKMDSGEKSLQETSRELLNDIIESVIAMNANEKSMTNDKMEREACISIPCVYDKENLKETSHTKTCDSGNLYSHTEDVVVNDVLVDNSFNKDKHLQTECCLFQCDSDSDFSDSPQNQVTNFSEDSMLSEFSYQSSCQSSHSYMSESLIPDIPSESLTALQNELKCVPAVSSSSLSKTFSELNAVTTLSENCSNQLFSEDSTGKNEKKSVTAKELECSKVLSPTLDIQDKSLTDGSVLIGEGMDLNQAHFSSPSSICEVQSETSKEGIECDKKREEEDSHVPVSLPRITTPLQTSNELNAPSNNSSVCTQDDAHVLGSDCSKDSSNLFYDSLYLKTPRPFFQTFKSTKVPSNSGKLCNAMEKYDSINENVDEDSFDKSPSYATLTAKYGLVFKDALSAGREPILTSGEKKDSLPVQNESNILSAVNTISWNPNPGCHFWLFIAGNSGIARLACVSELCKKENMSVSSQESIM
ncbi:general transcription factor 3C polypeptide 2 [Nephila pilipes]|uniref:General transcription factor 3C polypeptide 2 n=1 Tax=Nephila pilipes TaxID=299642 RepID=A0A8X6QQS6_NEPPI|nr:general transcription factor 3C polypeptide 2 [Nephila pilipes]